MIRNALLQKIFPLLEVGVVLDLVVDRVVCVGLLDIFVDHLLYFCGFDLTGITLVLQRSSD